MLGPGQRLRAVFNHCLYDSCRGNIEIIIMTDRFDEVPRVDRDVVVLKKTSDCCLGVAERLRLVVDPTAGPLEHTVNVLVEH